MSKAIEAEANEESVTVEWRGLKFDIPTDRDEWSYEAGLALEEGKYLVAVRELLPRDQFAAFRQMRPKNKDAGDLVNTIAEALGMSGAGE